MLKNSVRNSVFMVPVGSVFLRTGKSKLLIPCCRKVASTRDSSPNPQSGGGTKQLVLNQPLSFDTGLPETFLSQPETTSGLRFPFVRPSDVSEFPCPYWIFTGNPRWNVVTPSTPQPETTLLPTPLTPLKYFLPFPNGRSNT